MRNYKNLSLKKILLSVFAPLFLGTAVIGGTLIGDNTANAFDSDPAIGSDTIGAIYNSTDYHYDEAVLDTLAERILTNESGYSQNQPKKLSNLITYIKGTAQTHGVPVTNKGIMLQYGQYKYNSSDNYHPLVWMPVYMSTTADGQDAVLTLYLSTVNGPRSVNEYSPFSFNAQALSNKATIGTNPSNMYGSSYLRAFALGNGGVYGTYGVSSGTSNAAIPNYDYYHKYMDFLQYSYTIDKNEQIFETRKGNLYDDMVSPSEMRWQSYESYKSAIGSNVGTIYGTDGTTAVDTSGWEEYCWPNDAYGTPDAGSFYLASKFDYGSGSSSKNSYTNWKDDKVWLPSLTEVGTTDGNDGLWKLSNEQRAMFLSQDGQAAETTAWLRTANTAYADASDSNGSFSVAHMFVVQKDGSIGVRSIRSSDNPKAMTMALRPAIHLNLSSAQKKIKPPVKLDDVVYTDYIGRQHRLDSTSVTLTPEQSAWFVKGQMEVRFAYDRAMTKLANPINAGEYYMEVTLNKGSNLYFINPSEDDEYKKIVKFVVRKAKVGVKWTMDGAVPTAVEFAPGTKFFDRDINAGTVPEIAIRYKDYTNSKIYEVEFDELLRGHYSAEAYIVNDDLYKYNYELSGEILDPVQADSTFRVGRRVVDFPYITGAGEGVPNTSDNNRITYTMTYKGNQYIQVENVDKYLCVSVTSKGGTIECLNDMREVVVNGQKKTVPVISDSGTLTYRIKDVDTYTFNFEFPNDTQFTWKGDYVFDGSINEESGAKYEPEHLVVDLRRSEVTAEFVGLPNEWSTIHVQTFTVELRGIYEHIDGVEIPLSVRYMNDKSGDTFELTAKDGVYTLSGLAEGSYTLYAGFVSNDAYDKLYYFASGNKTQTFKVLQTVSTFDDTKVNWQYTHKGETHAAGKFNDHITPALAFEFDYDGDDYIFSLTTDEATLRDTYYVKAIYSGAKFVSNAGNYSITVEIKAYYKNVKVDEKSYTLYFNINPAKYDISGLEWDYDSSKPFTYDGKDHKVRITTDSLAALPGLTVSYSTNGNRIDAGGYTTTASFLISGEHANNYVLPVAGDENSYEGNFAFTCDWTVNKAKLTVEWLEPDNSGSSLLRTPVLKKGGEFVTYSYEQKVGGSWVAATQLKADGSAETFRAIAVLKPEYVDNYELENNEPCEFIVESGKVAVNIHFEVDGKICNDGDKFAYTGKPVKLELKVDGGTVNDGYTFKYYKVNGDDTRTELDGEPFDVGKYVAKVSVTYGSETFITGETEVTFEIVKADYDVNEIYWIYTHGDTIIAARYSPEQGKFVDEQGKEVEFVFEYDGTPHVLTVECQQQFTDPDDVLSVFTLTGEVQINAGQHEATVDFTYNTSRFNNPHDIFPRKLVWTITKQKIDYNKVEWGYINEDGEEKKFDFDKDSFRYTRNENGPVGYTVALIGLPEGVRDLMTYTTKNNSVAGSTATPGNTRAAVGDYLTSFTITGTWTDPSGNHEDFDASTFPLSIPASRTWSIKKRELSTLDFNGSWTVFDDRAHDLIELCNIPYTELNYFKVDITFVDGAFTVFNEYEGYNGVANSLYHAGKYEIRLYEKITKDVNGTEVEDLQIYDVLTFDIAKAVLEVVWDEKGSYPIAVAKNVYSTDMITTVYLRENGAEVPLAYVKSTNGEETFTATVRVSENYVNDVTFKMGANQPDSVAFNYSPFQPTVNAAQLELPRLVVTELKYTGAPQTFEIENWNTTYSSYLYIASGDLTQTEIGDYSVVIRFFKTADAYWKNATAESGEYNRDSITLSFSILPPTEWALDYPTLERDVEQWTGEDIEFKIVNWVAYSKYLTFEVFKEGESFGDNLTFKHGGLYTIEFSFPESSIGYWRYNADNPRGVYRLQFEIVGDPEAPQEIRYPEFLTSSAEYNGSELQFKVKDWDNYFAQYLDMSGAGVVSIKNGVVTVKNIGTYTITFTIKSNSSYTFVDNKTTYTLNISVTPPPDDNVPVEIQKPTLDKTEQEWTSGKTLTFGINNWVTIYSKYLDISCDSTKVEIDARAGTLKVGEIGVYTITLTFKEGANACWTEPEGSTDPYKLTFAVTASLDPNQAIKPSLKTLSKQWTGKDVYFELVNFDPAKVKANYEVFKDDGGTYYIKAGKAVGDYTVIFELIGSDLTWLDGTAESVAIDFKIVKLTIGSIDIGEDGLPIITDSDGNKFTGDLDGHIKVEYYDKDGNKVNKEDLKPGEKYYVKFIVDDPDGFKDKVTNGKDILDLIGNKNNENGGKGGFIINNYQPPQSGDDKDKDGDGMNPLWWIAIGGAILAVVAILGVIIALATRNNGGGYDDGYGYDDYYDDEYDYDDDEDDYDDYDDDYDDYDDEY